MPIEFDRSTCCNLNETILRESLITNGLGGNTNGNRDWSRYRGGHLARESGRDVGNAAYPEAAQPILSLTLLPFSAYRRYNQPQYGNNDWHFQVQLHSNAEHRLTGELYQVEDEEENYLPLPKGVTGCTIRA